MGIRHPLSIPRGRTIDIVMKLIFAATIIALSVASAHSITCYQCPYGILPNEKCLNDGADPGKEHNCLNPLDNACETLAIDDPAASLHYNRRCAHKPFNHGWGCYNATISIQGEGDYDGRVCYCQDVGNIRIGFNLIRHMLDFFEESS